MTRFAISPSVGIGERAQATVDFDESEYEQRWARTRHALSSVNADILLVTSAENLRYFCGYKSMLTRSKWRAFFFVLPADASVEPFLVLPGQEEGNGHSSACLRSILVAPESVASGYRPALDVLVEALAERGLDGATVGTEDGFCQRIGMTYQERQTLGDRLPAAHFIDATDAIWSVRSVKSKAEMDALRVACEVSCAGVRRGFEQMRPGMTERELHRLMAATMFEEGADDVWLMVGSGAKGYGVFNSIPSESQLIAGDLVWIDGGAFYRGYACDFIRTAFVERASDDQRFWYHTALRANQAAVAAVAPHAPMQAAFAAAGEVINGAGLGTSWGLNVLGHGVGLDFQEPPAIVEGTQETFLPGHVVTIEPSLSPPNHEHGHYIIEEIVAVRDQGVELLTKDLPPDLWIV